MVVNQTIAEGFASKLKPKKVLGQVYRIIFSEDKVALLQKIWLTQTPRMKSRASTGRKTRRVRTRPIQRVHSPVLLHHHLKLDRDKPFQEAVQQVSGQIEKSLESRQLVQNLVVAIDITCSPDLIADEFAEQFVQSIFTALDQQYPGLRDRFAGISDDEKRLPLRDLMSTGELAWDELDNTHLLVYE